MLQLLEEMRDTVPKEFDFLREAKLMQVIAARAKAARLRGVIIPQPLLALSSKELLVMQRMPGTPLPPQFTPATIIPAMSVCRQTSLTCPLHALMAGLHIR